MGGGLSSITWSQTTNVLISETGNLSLCDEGRRSAKLRDFYVVRNFRRLTKCEIVPPGCSGATRS